MFVFRNLFLKRNKYRFYQNILKHIFNQHKFIKYFFFRRRVLQITPGIEDLGDLQWELALYLVFSWVVIYFIIWRGLHQSGKVSVSELLLVSLIVIVIC